MLTLWAVSVEVALQISWKKEVVTNLKQKCLVIILH